MGGGVGHFWIMSKRKLILDFVMSSLTLEELCAPFLVAGLTRKSFGIKTCFVSEFLATGSAPAYLGIWCKQSPPSCHYSVMLTPTLSVCVLALLRSSLGNPLTQDLIGPNNLRQSTEDQTIHNKPSCGSRIRTIQPSVGQDVHGQLSFFVRSPAQRVELVECLASSESCGEGGTCTQQFSERELIVMQGEGQRVGLFSFPSGCTVTE